MKYRMTFELDDDYTDDMKTAESRAHAVAMLADSEADIDLKILSVEECESPDTVPYLKDIPKTTCHFPWWEDSATDGKIWVMGPDTGKGVGIDKLSKEYWKDLGEFENIYDVPYLKGILTLPEIDDETRERIIKQIDMLSDTMPILQLPEVMSKTYTVQDLKQDSNGIIIVRWDEIDDGDYYGETQFCESWEEAVDYMKKQGKKIYEIEIEGEENEQTK